LEPKSNRTVNYGLILFIFSIKKLRGVHFSDALCDSVAKIIVFSLDNTKNRCNNLHSRNFCRIKKSFSKQAATFATARCHCSQTYLFMKKIISTCLFMAILSSIFAQSTPKHLEFQTTRISGKIKIDGKIDEADWQKVQPMTDFVNRWPNPGVAAALKTEVRILYDNNSLYLAFRCFDNPDSLNKPLNIRDNLDNSDYCGILIDTYKDGQNANEFDLMPSNVQYDSKFSVANTDSNNGNGDGEDDSWDAVFATATQIVADGWTAEFEIPYSALRFPKTAVQTWSFNIWRHVARKGITYCWNPVAPDQKMLVQSGVLTGISDIKAPLRLSISPFLATNFQNYYDNGASPKSTWGRQYSAGMDLKYGLNEAFTLDATIIPDFSQVRSDNNVLNLSPFEVRFNENRPFFMEGTELFNKGGLFYSRRIGGRVINRWKADYDINNGGERFLNEEVLSNPRSAQLLNATKISGRTQKGLGIGFFNAVEAPTTAEVRNIETGETRGIRTSSLTDKNILVLDQNLKNNGFVTLINTLVLRDGGDYDASVTGTSFNLKNKKNSYSVSGAANMSQRFFSENTERGHSWNINVDKTSGKWGWHLGMNTESDKYNPNDLGYLYAPNERSGLGWINYSQYKPQGRWNNWWTSMWVAGGGYYKPNVFQNLEMGINLGGNTKTFHNMGVNLNGALAEEKDYFEPRTDGFTRYWKSPRSIRGNYWYNSDSRKTWQISSGAFGRVSQKYNSSKIGTWGGVSKRFGSKISIGFEPSFDFNKNDIGYALPEPDATSVGFENLTDNDIIFAKRNVFNWDNGLNFTYTFNSKMNLSLRGRHYWSRVKNNSFHLLTETGGLADTKYKGINAAGRDLHDITANYFNIDCIYTWRFAPGSDLIFVWKNAIYNENQVANRGYLDDLGQLGRIPQSNGLSLKVLYWLDYAVVKRKF
jgi:Domain of unknown function (DUF5916)/Carbohydrate family 9 binding domain-like